MNASQRYTIGPVAGHDLFQEADGMYASIRKRVESEEWAELSHADVERHLAVEGRELMRLLLQDHYTLRGRAKPIEAVVGVDGAERTHVREGTSRPVETVFGKVRAKRTAYCGRGLSALHPTDALLNLPAGRLSLELERQIALGAARMSFDATVDQIERTTGAKVVKRQAEEATQSAAYDFLSFYDERTFEAGQLRETGPLLILTFDQKGVVLRKEDLREATRKKAETQTRKLESRHCRGEPHGRKRMSTVAAVYTIERYDRSALDFIKGLRRIKDVVPKPRPRPESKRLWASLEESPPDVIRDAFAEALKRDPHNKKRWIVLIDGDEKLETWVTQIAKECGVEVQICLDVIHASEYLWKAGKAFHKEETPELEAWVLERLQKILEGGVSNVVAGMTRSATLRELTDDQREPVDACATYYLKRTHLMQYDELLRAGAPIATGVIEGGCRYLVNDRLDITGATWSLQGAEAVLCLRALLTSEDFDEYWAYHEEQERHRNHDSRYANERSTRVQLDPERRKLRVVN